MSLPPCQVAWTLHSVPLTTFALKNWASGCWQAGTIFLACPRGVSWLGFVSQWGGVLFLCFRPCAPSPLPAVFLSEWRPLQWHGRIQAERRPCCTEAQRPQRGHSSALGLLCVVGSLELPAQHLGGAGFLKTWATSQTCGAVRGSFILENQHILFVVELLCRNRLGR